MPWPWPGFWSSDGRVVYLPTIPRNEERVYTEDQVVNFSVTFGKLETLKAISDSQFGPSQETMLGFFPDRNEVFSGKQLRLLFSNYDVGSQAWIKRANQVSLAEHGPSVESICESFGGKCRRYGGQGELWHYEPLDAMQNIVSKRKIRRSSSFGDLSDRSTANDTILVTTDDTRRAHRIGEDYQKPAKRPNPHIRRNKLPFIRGDKAARYDEEEPRRQPLREVNPSSQVSGEKHRRAQPGKENNFVPQTSQVKRLNSRRAFGVLKQSSCETREAIPGESSVNQSSQQRTSRRQQPQSQTRRSPLSSAIDVLTDEGNVRKDVAEEIINSRKRPTHLAVWERQLLEFLRDIDDGSQHAGKRSKKSESDKVAETQINFEQVQGPEWSAEESSKNATYHMLKKDGRMYNNVGRAISGGSVDRAGKGLAMWLKSSDGKEVKDVLLKELSTVENASVILSSIKSSVSHHHSKGSRAKEAASFIYHLAFAVTFRPEGAEGKALSVKALQSLTGLGKDQIAIGRKAAKVAASESTQVKALGRNARSDRIQEIAQGFIYDWILDHQELSTDPVSRLDTNQNKKTVINPHTGQEEDVARRIWNLATNLRRHEHFIKSAYYADFQRATNNATIAIRTFEKVLKKVAVFVSDPKVESCVDEKFSQSRHYMSAIAEVFRTLPREQRETLQQTVVEDGHLSYEHLNKIMKKEDPYQLADAICCPKIQCPELRHEGIKDIPKIVPVSCSFGTGGLDKKDGFAKEPCPHCREKRKLGILDTLAGFESLREKKVDVKEWYDADRQGTNSKGQQNKQRELGTKSMTVPELISKCKKQNEILIPHVAGIRHMQYVREYDLSNMDEDTIVISTDFGATMDLYANELKNASVNDHAVICNFVVYSNRRMRPGWYILGFLSMAANAHILFCLVQNEDGTTSLKPFYDVDVHHFIADTKTKGKKADHATHNTALDKIIELYKDKIPNLKRVIINTDNCPGQYRCRQTFLKIASIVERHPGIQIIHALAIVENFKGVHDSVGKDIIQRVRQGEKEGDRSENGFRVFVNCRAWLDGKKEWKALEAKGDYAAFAKKGQNAIDSRSLWYICETGEEQALRQAEEPSHAERILLCDRSYIMDTQGRKPIEGTTSLHEICSVATSIPSEHPRKYPVLVANWPCRCVVCRDSKIAVKYLESEKRYCYSVPRENAECKWNKHRKQRIVYMTVACLSHDDARALNGKAACYLDGGKRLMGNINNYNTDAQEWEFVPEDDEEKSAQIITMKYKEACQAMQLYQYFNK